MPRLLWISDIHCASGFATVAQALLPALQDDFDIHVLGLNFTGDDHRDCPWHCYPAQLGGDLYGLGRIDDLVSRLQPDLIGILNDPWIVAEFLARDLGRPLVAYMPVDGENVATARQLNGLRLALAYTGFGAQALRRGGYSGPLALLPHGLDRQRFRPLDQLSQSSPKFSLHRWLVKPTVSRYVNSVSPMRYHGVSLWKAREVA